MTDCYAGLMLPPNDPLFTDIKNPHVTLAYFSDTEVHELAKALGRTIPLRQPQLRVTGSLLWARKNERWETSWISAYTVESTDHYTALDAVRDEVLRNALDADIDPDESFRFTPHITRAVHHHALDVANAGMGIVGPGPTYTIKYLTIKQVGGPENIEIPFEFARSGQ